MPHYGKRRPSEWESARARADPPGPSPNHHISLFHRRSVAPRIGAGVNPPDRSTILSRIGERHAEYTPNETCRELESAAGDSHCRDRLPDVRFRRNRERRGASDRPVLCQRPDVLHDWSAHDRECEADEPESVCAVGGAVYSGLSAQSLGDRYYLEDAPIRLQASMRPLLS